MGLLDDLKNEAEKKEAAKQREIAELHAQQDYYEQHLHAVMRRAHDYFSELVDTLNKVAPDVRAPYPADPNTQEPVGVKHGAYSFRSDEYDKPTKLLVTCDCELEEPREFYVKTPAAVSRYAELLDNHKFPYHTRNELDDAHNIVNAHFMLEGPLRVQIRLLASAEHRCLYIDLFNIEAQALRRHKLAPEKLDETLLDRLGRMLLREETVLVETRVSEETRAELRRKLEAEKHRLAEERARAEAEAEAQRLAEEEAKLINRAKRTVADRFKGILSRDD